MASVVNSKLCYAFAKSGNIGRSCNLPRLLVAEHDLQNTIYSAFSFVSSGNSAVFLYTELNRKIPYKLTSVQIRKMLNSRHLKSTQHRAKYFDRLSFIASD